MRQDVRDNWDWANQYQDQVEAILKNNIGAIIEVKIAAPEDDMKHATDLVLRLESGDVALRLRRDTPYLKTHRDFTIRSENGGNRTEIHKLKDGFCRWYLYGWVEGGLITNWMLIDLDKVRELNLLDSLKTRMNKDGITGFSCIPAVALDLADCLVASDLLTSGTAPERGMGSGRPTDRHQLQMDL